MKVEIVFSHEFKLKSINDLMEIVLLVIIKKEPHSLDGE